jgi:acyl-CoA synthetase (AMP-forming)/AMP-acid ligase II
VEVRGDDGAVSEEGVLGHIMVRGPSLMRGYLGQREATVRALRGGWLDTGDLGFVDGGELFVHGRTKDVVVLRGANHSPDEFEAPLESLPGIRAGCAVAVGFVAEGGNEQLLVLAERTGRPEEDGAVEEAALRAIRDRTGVIARVLMLAPGTLPRTSSGKMRRAEALRRHLAGELTPPASVTVVGMAVAVARSTLAYARARLVARAAAAPGEGAGPG